MLGRSRRLDVVVVLVHREALVVVSGDEALLLLLFLSANTPALQPLPPLRRRIGLGFRTSDWQNKPLTITRTTDETNLCIHCFHC